MRVSHRVAVIEMDCDDVLVLTGILDMALEGFERLDKEISAGGAVDRKIASDLREKWVRMLEESNWLDEQRS